MSLTISTLATFLEKSLINWWVCFTLEIVCLKLSFTIYTILAVAEFSGEKSAWVAIFSLLKLFMWRCLSLYNFGRSQIFWSLFEWRFFSLWKLFRYVKLSFTTLMCLMKGCTRISFQKFWHSPLVFDVINGKKFPHPHCFSCNKWNNLPTLPTY